MYLSLVHPFESAVLNKMEIFNEIIILIVTYHMLLFTDYTDDDI